MSPTLYVHFLLVFSPMHRFCFPMVVITLCPNCILPFSLILLSHKHPPVITVFVNSIWSLSLRLFTR